MKSKRIAISLIMPAALLLNSTSHALTLKGIEIPAQINTGQNTLVLNGAGIRSKFVFDIYVGALYLNNKTSSADAIINDQGAKQVSMYFTYDEISREKMTNGWNEGFEKVLNDQEHEQLKSQIVMFNHAFGKTVAGDVIAVQYTPGIGTRVIINNETKATIPGFDFHQALMKIWFGNDPVDEGLKQGMLGKMSAN